MLKSITILAILSGFSSLAAAQEGVHTGIHHLYQTPRAMGMGGAFVAVADDYSTVMYNPANLSRLDEGQINMSMDAQFSGAQMKTFFDDLNTASNSSSNGGQQTTAINEVMQKNYGKQYTVRAGLLEGVASYPGWGIAVLPLDFTADVKVHNQVTPALNMRVYADTTIALGFGRKIKNQNIPGRLSWGVTGKFVNRGYASRLINALDLAIDSNVFKQSDLRFGYTADFDLGFLYSPAVGTDGLFSFLRSTKPTFGLVVRNVLDYGFGKSFPGMNKTEVEAPEKLYRVIDIGSKFELPSFSIFGSRFALDVADIMHPNFNTRKGLHAGFEFDWRMASWWKGQYQIGLNQGYLSTGFSALFTVFRLDFVTYSEDVGSYSSPLENRLYWAKLNIDW